MPKRKATGEDQEVTINDVEVIQVREALNEEVVTSYCELITDSGQSPLPPITIFRDPDNGTLRCADGSHRLGAYKAAGCTSIHAVVHDGDERAAILHAVGANAQHGLRRTRADKRNAVLTLLKDAEWVGRSDHWIAKKCNVSQPFVSKLREELDRAVKQAIGDPELESPQEGGPGHVQDAPTENVINYRIGRDGKRRKAVQRKSKVLEQIPADETTCPLGAPKVAELLLPCVTALQAFITHISEKATEVNDADLDDCLDRLGEIETYAGDAVNCTIDRMKTLQGPTDEVSHLPDA